MANLQEEFQDQFNDVVSRLESHQFFQSDWDIASFAVFFIFIVIHLCVNAMADFDQKHSPHEAFESQPRRRKVGIENMGLDS
uniref:Uncharacterized protein n=1 Tax=Gadus morhua TaxID=8049 RepID=A0A8C5A2V6_GADMO